METASDAGAPAPDGGTPTDDAQSVSDVRDRPDSAPAPADGMARAPDSAADQHHAGDTSSFSSITRAGGGTLKTAAGTWSFGTEISKSSVHLAGTIVLLDGRHAGGGYGVEIVAQGGSDRVYITDQQGFWYRWNGVDQWTPEVTGDPRNPVVAPALGVNTFTNPRFTMGWMPWVVLLSPSDAACTGTCKAAIQNLSPEAGGKSIHVEVPSGNVGVERFFNVTAGKTNLLSMWSTGKGGILMHDSDPAGGPGITVLPSRGWVQTFCTFIPGRSVVYLKSITTNANMTDFYAGLVDASYPAPKCR